MKSHSGETKREIQVYADQYSTAWAVAAENVGRMMGSHISERVTLRYTGNRRVNISMPVVKTV